MNRKKLFYAFLTILAFNYSCESDKIEEEVTITQDDTSLITFKEAEKISGEYIVLLGKEQKQKMFENNTQLKNASNYRQRQSLVRSYVEDIFKSGEIALQKEAIMKVYSSKANVGFLAKLEPRQAKLLKEKGYKVHYNVIFGINPICQIIPWLCSETGDVSGGEDRQQKTPWGIARVGGPRDFSKSSKTAWVIDTGIDLDHPDLNVDVARSKDFTGKGTPDDGNGHGTHVAGTIGAINNNFGVVGVAAGVKVAGIKVLSDQGSESYANILAGVDYVAQNSRPGDVVNLSLGGPSFFGGSFPAETALIKLAATGVYVSVAAGNSSAPAAFFTPAKANGKNFYTISSMNNKDDMSYFSNWGGPVDYAAPGSKVNSTLPGGRYGVFSGTSMAAPHAAGVLLVTNGRPNADGKTTGDFDGGDKIIHN